MKYTVLILGASYGSLLGTKLSMAGHRVNLVCTQATAELINREGARVRFPIQGRAAPLEIASNTLPGKLCASVPDTADPDACDLVVLGMQESQYGANGVRHLMRRIARSRKPCLAIMNMPPLPYLKRIRGLDTQACRAAYTDPTVWDGFDPAYITLCSPDPQAFRPPEEKVNVLQVRLPTNFKAARFESDAHTAILRQLESDVEEARFDDRGARIELPVKLKVHDSIFVPLAKWPMLIAGNYRCVTREGIRTIREAVHSNPDATRAVYDWVVKICVALGAAEKDLVPFEKYANAALSLQSPSSAARALYGGAPNIERVDRLVKIIGAQKGMQLGVLDETVALVDERLEANRKKAG